MEVKNYPLVSVGVLCFNTGRYILESLDCVKRQNYPNVELIIIDDCSTDGVSVNMIKDWLERNRDLPWKIQINFRKKNEGVHAGLNEILEKAKGKYLNFISDDLWSDDKLTKQVQLLDELGDEYALCYGRILLVDKDSKLYPEKDSAPYNSKKLLQGKVFSECINDFSFYIQASTIRLDLLKKTNFKFNKNYISEDWHLVVEIARHYKIYGTTDVTAYYRLLPHSITRTLWQKDNMHNIIFSQYDMILSYLNHPLNSLEDKITISKKLLNLLLQIKCINTKIRLIVLKRFVALAFISKNKKYLLERFPKILKVITN